jgi:hypothetical protein
MDLSILLSPCGAIRHCGAVPHYVFQCLLPKKINDTILLSSCRYVNSQSLFTNFGASKSIWFFTALPPLPLLPLLPLLKGLRAIFRVLCTNSIYAVGMGIASAYSPCMVLARAYGFFSTAPAITAFAAAPIVKGVKGYIFKVLVHY